MSIFGWSSGVRNDLRRGVARSSVPRRRLAVVAALFALGAVSSSAHAQRRSYRASVRTTRMDTTLAFDRQGTLTVTSQNDIAVTSSSDNRLHIRGSDAGDVRVTITASGRTGDVVAVNRGEDVRLDIAVPPGVHVIARSMNGEVSVRGTRGPVDVQAQNGDVTVDDVVGHLEIHALSGDVSASRVTGTVDIATTSSEVRVSDAHGNVQVTNTSGGIELRSITALVVRARTTSGDVTYEGTIDPSGRYELVSHSGDVRLRLPRDANAQLTVATWNGEIESEFPITLKPGKHGIGASVAKNISFTIGRGGAQITAETFSGDVTISSGARPSGKP